MWFYTGAMVVRTGYTLPEDFLTWLFLLVTSCGSMIHICHENGDYQPDATGMFMSNHTCGVKWIDHDWPSGTRVTVSRRKIIGWTNRFFQLQDFGVFTPIDEKSPKKRCLSPKKKTIVTLQGTNISHQKWHFWVDDFPFPFRWDMLIPWTVVQLVLPLLGSHSCPVASPGAPSVFRSTPGCCRASSEGGICRPLRVFDIMTSLGYGKTADIPTAEPYVLQENPWHPLVFLCPNFV